MSFLLTITRPFKRRLKRKELASRLAVKECIAKLAVNPHHPGLHTHSIRGARNVFEAYVNASDRVSWQYGAPGEIILRNHCRHDAVLSRP
jgi:hypothetical protein